MASIIFFFSGGYFLVGLACAVLHFSFVSTVMLPKEIYIEIGKSPAAFERQLGKSVIFNKNYPRLEFHTIDLASRIPRSVILKKGASEV